MLLLFFCWALNFSFELNFVFGILFRIRFRNQTNDKNSVKPTADAFSWYCFWITSKQHLSVHAREQELMLLTRVHPPNKFTTANITPFVCTMTFCEDYFFVLSGVTLPTDLVGVEFTINIHPNMNSRLYPQMTIVTHVGTVLQYMSRLELDFCRQNILFSHWVLFQLSRMWNVEKV